MSLPDQLIESRAKEALSHLTEATKQEIDAYLMLIEKRAKESVKVNPPPPFKERLVSSLLGIFTFGAGSGGVGGLIYVCVLLCIAMAKGCNERAAEYNKEQVAKEAIQDYEAQCQRTITELQTHKQRLEEENQKLSQIRNTLAGFCSPDSSLQNLNSP